ncbi:MAG: response regulator [Gammaproteobacteria bacterium]
MNSEPHILIVDDEPFNLEILTENLAEKNYTIETAVDGQDALEKLESDPKKYDVILLDRVMPRLDGMEALKRIKSHPDLKNCPVIIQSALDNNEEILEGMRTGAFYYLTKPFEQEQLLSIVDTAVQDRMQFKELQEMVHEEEDSLGLMVSSSFRFQTIEQARSLASFLAKACPDPSKVVVGLSELMINAVEHGNLGITYEEKTELNSTGGSWVAEVSRRLELEENKHKYAIVGFQHVGRYIEITIEDQGEGFDWRPYMEIEVERLMDSHGRGIAMASMLSFENIEYRGVGNEVLALIECPEFSASDHRVVIDLEEE